MDYEVPITFIDDKAFAAGVRPPISRVTYSCVPRKAGKQEIIVSLYTYSDNPFNDDPKLVQTLTLVINN